MKSLNEIRIIGNLTMNPDVKTTPSGVKVATFAMATNRVWKDSTGNKQEKVTFHNVVVWSGLAEIAEKFLEKGNPCYISGYLDNRTWEKEDGTKGYRTEIVADNLILLGGKREGTPDREIPPEFQTEGEKAKRPKPPVDDINIEDLPF